MSCTNPVLSAAKSQAPEQALGWTYRLTGFQAVAVLFCIIPCLIPHLCTFCVLFGLENIGNERMSSFLHFILRLILDH